MVGLGGEPLTPTRKYDASDQPGFELEPGASGHVLKNRLGIRTESEIERAEAIALANAHERLFDRITPSTPITAALVCEIHRVWLSDLYDWAGTYRTVTVSKGGFPFAAAGQIARLMNELEDRVLATLTPCRGMPRKELIHSLAVVHAELVLIHPFPDGNGRVTRLVATLMALQAGYDVIDFSPIDRGSARDRYFGAVREALGRDYAPMASVFETVLPGLWPPEIRKPSIVSERKASGRGYGRKSTGRASPLRSPTKRSPHG